MKRYFITGTDTDCGKTYVTTKLCDFFSKAVAIKPIASGCELENNQLVNADALLLQRKSDLTLDQVNPWRFNAPVSPHLAARADGMTLTMRNVTQHCLTIQPAGAEFLFIEGAGGIMVPLNDEETWIDFLKQTKIPVLLVVGMKLGCINHALLTESVLAVQQINCAGWIANCLDPHMLMLKENIETLKNKLKSPLLGVVPYAGDIADHQMNIL